MEGSKRSGKSFTQKLINKLMKKKFDEYMKRGNRYDNNSTIKSNTL